VKKKDYALLAKVLNRCAIYASTPDESEYYRAGIETVTKEITEALSRHDAKFNAKKFLKSIVKNTEEISSGNNEDSDTQRVL
jgi:hypothetical protein